MSKYRQAARVDDNQGDIVKLLRSLPGVTVQTGMDDILVGHAGKTYWFEIKNPDTVSKNTGKILESAKKKSQKKLESEWKGHYRICSNVFEILKDIGIEIV